MNDNNEKWNDLINESFKYPSGLGSVEKRFEKRIKKEKRYKRAFISSLSAVAASLIFVILVNTSTAFANVVAELPVIRKLAEYVKFDKSLSMAIENEYVQGVNLVAWDGENRLLLPYVIADEKNLVLFFQLPDEFKQESNQWVNIFKKNVFNSITGDKIEGFSYSTSGLSAEDRKQDHGFIMHEYHFSEGTLPKSIDIEVEMIFKNYPTNEDDKNSSIYDEPEINYDTVKVGNFTFHIKFEEFAKPLSYVLDKNLEVLGQQIIVENIKVYPTGTEVNFSFPTENSAWIKGLELEVLQDGSNAFKGNNGLSASQDIKNGWMSVFVESNYFEKPKKQELLIKSVRLLDKDEEYITIDLDEKNITPNIEGMELNQVIKKSDNVSLVFFTDVSSDDNFGMFYHDYKDIEGNDYSFRSEGTTSRDSKMETYLTVEYPPSGKVVLKRALTPKIYLEDPIRIDIR